MKTLETVNGQKVWAVDETLGCEGCMFNKKLTCNKQEWMDCWEGYRPDNRNVIFQPYEEEEKTFTLSQINEVIEQVEAECPYNEKEDLNIYFTYNEAWRDALSVLKQKLEQL